MQVLRTGFLMAVSAAGLGALGCGAFLNGCSRETTVTAPAPSQDAAGQPQAVPQQPQIVQQPPQVVEAQPQYIIVQQAPPAVIVESRPSPPSVTHVWIDGSWNWSNQRYSWVAGRYVLPPQPDVIWIGARYDHDAKGYRYTPGQWKKQERGNDNNHDRTGR